jgi:hypothetical protein
VIEQPDSEPPPPNDSEPPPPSEAPRRRRRRSAPPHRHRHLLAGTGIVVALIVAATILAVVRYLPALDEARSLRTDLVAMASRVQAAGLEIDRPALDGLGRDLAAARDRLNRLADLLAKDPLVGVARVFPPTAADVRGADTVIGAARDVFDAADQGMAIGGRFVQIKEAQAAAPGTTSALAQLVELMATSRDRALAAQAALARAHDLLATVPDGLAGPVENARDAMAQRVDKYGPLLDAYVTVSARLPAILGWDGPRRYLVLTQNPAELRPTGGYTGSYGIIAFDRGRVTERSFRDIFLLDLPWSYPFIKPPTELANYLLGPKQPWQLADANWSPDFPTSAQDAIRLYTNESGDTKIDGVLGITTYTIDELLKVTGPVTIPEYQATIASGETTLKTLQLTRVARKPGDNRKAFLSTFADRLLATLLGLPPRQWGEILGQANTFQSQRLLLAWFKNAADEAFVTTGGFGGAVRQDPGDYVYPVDSNVAPASKMNAIATRSLRLEVAIDPLGNAQNTLDVTWQNPIDTPVGKPYRELPTLENLRILGMYFRLLAPERSRVVSVSGGSFARLSAPAVVAQEAGRTVIGAYLMVPPGSASLRYVWISPYAADADETGGLYRLTIQKQPGLLPGPLTLTIRVPDGFRISAASQGLTVAGQSATLQTTFTQDIVLGLRYAPTTAPTPTAP